MSLILRNKDIYFMRVFTRLRTLFRFTSCSSSSRFLDSCEATRGSHPKSFIIRMTFIARESISACRRTWFTLGLLSVALCTRASVYHTY